MNPNLRTVGREYLSEISKYSQKQQLEEHLDQRSSGMLGLLHKLKLICAHPHSVQMDNRLRDHSPKLQWLTEYQLHTVSHAVY